jgi:predicted phage terminase large subunit-like protein
MIRRTAQQDGPGVTQAVEAFGGYKDAYTTLKRALTGFCIVKKSLMPGDKSAKLAPLEPAFDAGTVHILRGPWLDEWQRQFREFPDGAHDDFCDATAVMFHEQNRTGSGMLL